MQRITTSRQLLLLLFFTLIGASASFACDTTPTITASNVQSIGGGLFTIDVEVCIGVDGSMDGYDLSMNCGLNIVATNQATQNNGGNIAVASIAGGVLTYFYGGAGDFEPDDGIVGPCFTQTITVDGDPLGCTVTSTGLNDYCNIIQTSWSATIPGPCVPDFTLLGAGSVSGNTSSSGNTCTLRGSNDQIIEIGIPCDDTWTFSLCGGSTWDTYLYLGTGCCTSNTALNDDACGLQSEISTFLTAGTYYITVEAFSTFGSGAYTLNVSSANPCSFLPVGLTEFSGEYNEVTRSNKLHWVTESETNNDYFIVERSGNGGHFTAIADIDGAGNTSTETNYTYYDPVEVSGTYYYRLKQVDFDGSYTYSNVISIENGMADSHFFGSIFPNPAKTSFTLTTAARNQSAPIEVVFYNSQLKQIKAQTLAGSVNASNYSIDVSDLKSGVYTVHLSSGDEIEVRKVVIL
jgi:hypothetical protein